MFKRGNLYWTSITFNGVKHQKSLETGNKKLAQKLEAKIKTDIAEGKVFGVLIGNDKTFEDLAKRYLQDVTPSKSVRSQQRDEGTFRVHLVPMFGKMLLRDISARHIANYKSKRKADKASPDTINKELGLMKSAYNIALREWEWVESNPVTRVKMEKARKGRVRFLTDQEFAKLYAESESWIKPMILVAVYTGMRQGNLVKLRWKQIDLFRKVIILEETKNGEALSLPICKPLHETLIELNKVMRMDTDLVFADSEGKGIIPIRLLRTLKRACKRTGIEDFRWHDFRHQFASSLVQKGVGIFVVQKLLGHKDSRMTQRYAHLSLENLSNAVSVFDNVGNNLATIEGDKTKEGGGNH